MENPKRARSWKRRLRPRVNLKNDVPVLYSTCSTDMPNVGGSQFRSPQDGRSRRISQLRETIGHGRIVAKLLSRLRERGHEVRDGHGS